MKKITCTFCAFTAATAFAQAPQGAAGAARSNDVVQLVSMDQMPLPPPTSEGAKARAASVAKAKGELGPVERSPDTLRSFFNSLAIAKTYAAALELYLLTFGPDMEKGKYGAAKINSNVGACPSQRVFPTAIDH